MTPLGLATRRLRRRARVRAELHWRALERMNGEGLSLEAVGRLLGVTKERVRQIESEALRKFKAAWACMETGLQIPLAASEREPRVRRAVSWTKEARNEYQARWRAKNRERANAYECRRRAACRRPVVDVSLTIPAEG